MKAIHGMGNSGYFPNIDGLKSFYILKDGLPVFTKEFMPNNQDDNNNQMLVGGFLSALVSFLKDMKDFGEMRTLTTSSNVKFSFYQADSLIFVACTNGTLEDITVERLLRNLSIKFLQSYSKKISSTNLVNMKTYSGFETILQRELLSQELRGKNITKTILKKRNTPSLLLPKERVISEFYFNNPASQKIIKYIDGKTDIEEIAELSGLEQNQVSSFVRNMVKNGVVQM